MPEPATISPQNRAVPSASANDLMPISEHSRADRGFINSLSIQPKLTVGAPDDPYEKEADAVADRVMRMPEQNFVQRKCTDCPKGAPFGAKGEKIQKQAEGQEIVAQAKPVTGLPFIQQKCAGPAERIQREEKTENREASDKSTLKLQLTEPDFLSLRTPFFERNAMHLWDPKSALGVWHYNFDFFKRFGLDDNWSGKAANLTAPFFINSQLKVQNPTWWEVTDQQLNTTSIVGSLPVFSFDSDFRNWKPLPFLQKKSLDNTVTDVKQDSPKENFIQRKCAHCGEEEKITRKPVSASITPFIQTKTESNTPAVSDSLSQSIQSSKGGGSSLDGGTQTFMSDRFGTDFGNVKVHTDGEAVQMNRELNAKAFTVGRDVYFNEGQYQPGSSGGKHLLAHELTHVVQQNGLLQRQTSDAPANEEMDISAELLEIPPADDSEVIEAPSPDEMMLPATDNTEANEPYRVVQLKPSLIQRDDTTPAKVVRKDLVFIMGTKGGFYIAAKKFFSQHHPEATIVDFKDRSMGGIFKVLRTEVSASAPAGHIYIVSHANQDGTLSFPLNSKDKDTTLTFGELKVALKNNAALFKTSGGIDEQTSVHIKGCNIGRNVEMLNALDEAFGGKDKVDAPTHKQGYEYHTKKVKDKSEVVSSEYFNTLVVEYPGSTEKDTKTLVSDFQDKYSEFNYKEHEWQMMVMGVKKYTASIDKQGIDKKAEIDKATKEKKKEVDKADKAALNAIDADTKTAKAEVDTWIKGMKTSKVANQSPGASKKVDKKFTATLYNTVDPAITPTKALPLAGMLLGKSVPKGFNVTQCTSISNNSAEPLSVDFNFLAENKKKKETMTFTFTTPKFPKTDEQGSTIADELIADEIGKKPETEIARREMYLWRIERTKGKDTVKIKASLEMTQYRIDLDLKEESGDKIDPAKKEGKEFYYGSSDFK